MNIKIIAPVVILAALSLAGCDNKPAETATPAATAPAETPAPAATPAVTTPAPAATETVIAPAGGSMMSMSGDTAMEALKAQAANMTPEQKTQAVAAARKAAEDAARAAGQTDAQIAAVGDAAEAAAKQALGL